jgi:hypothetical protein
VSFQELRRQCDRDGIGPLFWDVLVEVCGRIARRYPPESYNNGESWSEEAFRDLAQEVALDRLLGENQLEYVLNLATDEDSLGRLLAFQARRVLSHRRATTVVDRLTTRVRAIAQSPPYEVADLGSDLFVSPAGGGRDPAFLPDADLRRGADLIDSIPRLPSSPGAARESKVYAGANVHELLQRLVSNFDGVALGDIRKILEITLTAWLPTILRDGEEDPDSGSTPELELQRSHMAMLIDALVQELDPVHRLVLLGKSQGVSDGELATRMGRSRPWLADRKGEVLSIVESRLIAELPEELHTEATRNLLDELAFLEETS